MAKENVVVTLRLLNDSNGASAEAVGLVDIVETRANTYSKPL